MLLHFFAARKGVLLFFCHCPRGLTFGATADLVFALRPRRSLLLDEALGLEGRALGLSVGALALSDTLFRPMLPPPGDPGLPCRRVSFHSGGVLLSGAVFGEEGRRGCLLLAHGMGVSWDYYLPQIRRFTELGYRVFAFSYRGYPGSGGRFRGFPQAARDVAAAIRFAGDGTLPLILWGHSMGAYAVCAALALTERPVERVVACAPFDDPAEAVREMAGRGIPGGRLTAAAVNAVSGALPRISSPHSAEVKTSPVPCITVLCHGR